MCGQAEYLVNLVNGSNPVPDSSMTASSTLVWAGDDFRPHQGRLYNQYQTYASGPYTQAPGVWAPATADTSQYIQVCTYSQTSTFMTDLFLLIIARNCCDHALYVQSNELSFVATAGSVRPCSHRDGHLHPGP